MATETGDGTWSAQIRGKRFLFSKWGAEKSLLTFTEICKLASFGIGDSARMLTEADKPGSLGQFLALLIKGIGDGFGNDPAMTLRVVKRLCCDGVVCDTKSIPQDTFDTFYREDILFALEVAKENIEVQYSTFFDKLAPAVALVRSKLKESLRQQASTT